MYTPPTMAVFERLQQQQLTISTAESLTAGLLQAELGKVSGISAHFYGGLAAYTLDSKVALLGVNRAHAQQVNCVSEQVVKEMAHGALQRFKTDVSIATTGYAECSIENGVTEPYAFIAVAIRCPAEDRFFVEKVCYNDICNILLEDNQALRMTMREAVTKRAFELFLRVSA